MYQISTKNVFVGGSRSFVGRSCKRRHDCMVVRVGQVRFKAFKELFAPFRSPRALEYVVMGLDSVSEDAGTEYLSVGAQLGSRWQPSAGEAGRESSQTSEFGVCDREGS
jgi:hypothetical protein